jgi:hypothetical protein
VRLDGNADEAEKFYALRRQLRNESTQNLRRYRDQVRSSIAEISWLNKSAESALFCELFSRTGKADTDLYSRVFFSVEDVGIWAEIFSGRRGLSNATRPESRAPVGDGKVLFVGSKFGDYVSSQEYYRAILCTLTRTMNFALASPADFGGFYTKNFECWPFKDRQSLEEVLVKAGVKKVVDLSGGNDEILRSIGSVHLADPWGRAVPGFTADSAIAWPENVKLNKFVSNLSFASQFTYIFVPPESSVRSYPDLVTSTVVPGQGRYVVLGAFCRTSKLNLRVIKLWARVLKSITNAILVFAFIQSNKESEAFVKKIFSDLGVSSDRIVFLPRLDTKNYLRMFNSVDVSLGAMPEQGGISCMDSLLMGCPYLVCEKLSNTFCASLVLKELGFTEWVAADEDDYLVKLETILQETNSARLESRAAVRGRLLSSKLSQAERVADSWRVFLSG